MRCREQTQAAAISTRPACASICVIAASGPTVPGYALAGSQILVAIFDDRLEIQNPGSFVYGSTVETIKQGISRATRGMGACRDRRRAAGHEPVPGASAGSLPGHRGASDQSHAAERDHPLVWHQTFGQLSAHLSTRPIHQPGHPRPIPPASAGMRLPAQACGNAPCTTRPAIFRDTRPTQRSEAELLPTLIRATAHIAQDSDIVGPPASPSRAASVYR